MKNTQFCRRQAVWTYLRVCVNGYLLTFQRGPQCKVDPNLCMPKYDPDGVSRSRLPMNKHFHGMIIIARTIHASVKFT